jgi:hypothetical protein
MRVAQAYAVLTPRRADEVSPPTCAGAKVTGRCRSQRRAVVASAGGRRLLEQALAEARPEAIEREVVAAALAATATTIGALFVHDKKARGLVLSHHGSRGST